MSITLSVGAVSVALNQDLYWEDELSYRPVEQSETRSITGALIVSVGQRFGGRPITLKPFSDGEAWTTRAEIETLNTWASTPGQEMQLTLRGIVRTVIFRHPNPIEGMPVAHYRNVQSGDWYRLTFRFLEK